jgi:uncharacterized membrane protein YraQ (UPF0718 family)
MKNQIKKISFSWATLTLVVIAYIILLVFNRQLFFVSLGHFYNIFIKVLPFFILTLILLVIANYFITAKYLLRHLRGSKLKKWLFVVLGGIISAGPVYMWYPLLADLEKKGLSQGQVACFLYAKAIKLPLLPLLIFYFGWKYFLVISLLMIIFSIIQGILINKLLKPKYENSHSL